MRLPKRRRKTCAHNMIDPKIYTWLVRDHCAKCGMIRFQPLRESEAHLDAMADRRSAAGRATKGKNSPLNQAQKDAMFR